jgi:hypothetical protein
MTSVWQDAPAIEYPSWAKVQKTKHGDKVDGCFMPRLEKYRVSESRPVSYSFRFDENWNWAIFTINDVTGEFSIQSDWGNWSYRWNVSNLGGSALKSPRPLTAFLANRDSDSYVADKLFSPDEKRRFDSEGTKKALRGHIISERRDGSITSEQAREAWEAVDDADYSTERDLVDSVEEADDDNLFGEGSYDIYEQFVAHKPCSEWFIVCYKLLPFFFDYLRREVLAEVAA